MQSITARSSDRNPHQAGKYFKLEAKVEELPVLKKGDADTGCPGEGHCPASVDATPQAPLHLLPALDIPIDLESKLSYSSILLELCKKINKEEPLMHSSQRRVSYNKTNSTDHRCSKLYSKLTQRSLSYPYASLLEQLCRRAHNEKCMNISDAGSRTSEDLKVSVIMKTLSYPLDSMLADECTKDCDNVSYSKKLQDISILDTLCKSLSTNYQAADSSAKNPSCEMSVGDILSGMVMGEHDSEHHSADQFYYSSLLLKACQTYTREHELNCGMAGGQQEEDLCSAHCLEDCCSSSSMSSDSYEYCSSKSKKRKSRQKSRRQTSKPRSKKCDVLNIFDTKREPDEKTPTLLKLLLTKDDNDNSAQSFHENNIELGDKIRKDDALDSHRNSDKSLLKNFLCKPSAEFKKYYSKICEDTSQSSNIPETEKREDCNLNNSSIPNKSKKNSSNIPDLIPCALIANPSKKLLVEPHSRGSTLEMIEEANEKKPVQSVRLSVASMLCRLDLYPSGETSPVLEANSPAECTDTSHTSSGRELKQHRNSTADVGWQQLGCDGSSTGLDLHQCALCRLPFTSSLDLQCHQVLFHTAGAVSEKLRN